ncbi:glycosyltransferase family 39 protein [Microbacterium lacus]|uniref:glycosyltransferase family 39 protein n=1 Tax=Microbacterium lacus TaxID=415217 RepID=UPI00384E7FF4
MRARLSWKAVAPAAVTLMISLAVTANGYGYHRDELYFRMLPSQWGYLDQPPLIPALARALSVIDEPWALRIPAIACAVAAVFVIALIAAEVGGTPFAQGLAAWGSGFGAFALLFGHVMLTASLDLVVWPLIALFVIRAVVREQPRWWLLAGLVTGLSMYNKLLVAQLVVALVLGLLIVGPRRALGTPHPYVAGVIAVVVGVPNLIYQATAGWPQLSMGAALAESNADEVRVLMWPFLFLLIGPPLVAFWVAGIIGVFRRPSWRNLRFIVVALAVVVLLTFAFGAQFYYPLGILVVVYAIGCVVVADWATTRGRRALTVSAVALNAVVSIVISLPVVPESVIGNTPIAGMNQAVADQIGWPAYAATIEEVAHGADASVGTIAIITRNYGEAGALDRFGSADLPPVFSGHNALAAYGPPSDAVTTVVFVGRVSDDTAAGFDACTVEGELDNGLNVDNEEQGVLITVCSGRSAPWTDLWRDITHLD